MPIPPVDINYIAVLVAAIVSIVIGMVWYSPFAFGKAWMKLSGISREKLEGMKKGMGKSYLASFIAALISSFVLAILIDFAQATSVGGGLMMGFLVWLGFIATGLLNTVLWEGKPIKLYTLNVAHHFVSLLVMGAILAVWA